MSPAGAETFSTTNSAFKVFKLHKHMATLDLKMYNSQCDGAKL